MTACSGLCLLVKYEFGDLKEERIYATLCSRKEKGNSFRWTHDINLHHPSEGSVNVENSEASEKLMKG